MDVSGTTELHALQSGNRIDYVVAWLLFGAVAMVMMTFYLVNFPDADIQKSTWSILSNTCSLLCAILIYKVQDAFVDLGFTSHRAAHRRLTGEVLVNESSLANETSKVLTMHSGEWQGMPSCSELGVVPSSMELLVVFIQMFVFYILVHTIMYFLRRWRRVMAAFSLIGSHAIGFANLSAYSSLMYIDPFYNSGAHSILVIVISGASMFCLSRIGGVVRHLVRVDEFTSAWVERCHESEDESCSFALGFLMSMSARSLLLNCMAQIHWEPEDTGTHDETNYLLGVAFGFIFLEIVATQLRRMSRDDDDEHRSRLERLADFFALTMSMAMGWCLLFWGQWLFWLTSKRKGFIGDGSLMVFSLEMVIMFTCGSFFILIVFDYVADRIAVVEDTLRSLSEAFVLLLGLSWEACFMRAVEGMSGGSDGLKYAWTLLVAVVILCIFIVPAWGFFILPHAISDEEGTYIADGRECADDRDKITPDLEHSPNEGSCQLFAAANLEIPEVKAGIVDNSKEDPFSLRQLARSAQGTNLPRMDAETQTDRGFIVRREAVTEPAAESESFWL